MLVRKDVKVKHEIEKTNKSIILQILQEIHILFLILCVMSGESTVSTAQGLIDVANARQDFHASNYQNNNDVMSQIERNEFLSYPRNFFDRITGGLPKDEEEANCLWPYRKARQNNGSGIADMVSADGAAMLNEMKDIRESL